MAKFEALTKTIIFALLGLLILTVAVPVIYLSVSSYLGNWTSQACSLVTGVGCVNFPADNTTIANANIPLGGLIATLVPLIFGIAILVAVVFGLLALVKWGKGKKK
jgi:hypothetical protein